MNYLADLERAINESLIGQNAAYLLAWIEAKIRKRTKQGEFLEGSSPNAKNYRSRTHKKRRKEKGLPIDRVTLHYGGEMLDAMKGDTKVFADKIELHFGYLPTAESEARKLAEYHNNTGAGKAKVVRRFIGLSPEEEKELAQIAEERLQLKLRQV
jgi:hypothetical protein